MSSASIFRVGSILSCCKLFQTLFSFVKMAEVLEKEGPKEIAKAFADSKDVKEQLKQDKMVSIRELFRFADSTDVFLMTLGTIAALGFGVMQPLLSVIMGDIVNAFLDYGRIVIPMENGLIPFDAVVLDQAKKSIEDKVLQNVYLFVGIGGAAFVGAYLMQSSWLMAGERISHRVREKFLRSVLRQDVEFFDKNEVGGLTTKLSSDTTVFQEGISSKCGLAISSISMFFTGFIIAFVKDWRLTLVLIAVTPLLGIGGYVVGTVIANETSNSQGHFASASSIAQETFSNIRTVTAFRGQKKALKRFSKFADEARIVNEKKFWKMGAGFGYFFGLLYGVYALAFWYGSILVDQGQTSGGTILNVIFAIIIGAFSIVNMAPAIQNINKARGVAKGLFEVIDSEPLIRNDLNNPGKKLEKIEGSIEFKNVTFQYPTRPDVPILENFSLKVEPGKTVALVGFSGSGKSTIIQLLERFYDPISGQILVEGVPLKDVDLNDFRNHVGLVSQEPILFDTTIEENIRYGAPQGTEVTEKRINEVLNLANASSFVNKLSQGIKTRVGEKGSLLSGGQKQRIAIARAIVKNPSILLLDEATSALDTESERIVQNALDEASKNRTTIVIAHRLSTIKNADKIVVMESGKIIEEGTHESLMAKGGHYSELVRVQQLKTTKGNGAVEEKIVEKVKEAVVEDAVAINVPEKELKEGDEKELTDEEKERIRLQEVVKKNKTPLLRVLKMQSREYWALIIGIIGAGGSGALLPIFGVIFGQILAVFSKTGQELLDGAAFWALVFMGMMFANFFTNLMQFGGFGVAGERLTLRIRESYFWAMMRQEITFFDDKLNGTGALTSRLAVDSERINNLTGPISGTILQLVVSLGVSLGLAFYYSWQMTLVVIGMIPILGIMSYFENMATFGSPEEKEKTQKSNALSAQTACDAIQNIRTVKSFNAEDIFTNQYLDNISVTYKSGIKKSYIATIGFGLSQATQFWVYAIAFYAGYRFVFDGIIVPGDLFTVLFAILFGSISLSQAATYTPDILKARVAAIEYFSLVDKVPTIDSYTEKGDQPKDIAGTAEIKNVQFSYPQRQDIKILKGVSFNVPPGKNIALVGPSGYCFTIYA